MPDVGGLVLGWIEADCLRVNTSKRFTAFFIRLQDLRTSAPRLLFRCTRFSCFLFALLTFAQFFRRDYLDGFAKLCLLEIAIFAPLKSSLETTKSAPSKPHPGEN